MAKKPGRKPWSPPDGVARQRPGQTAKTNAADMRKPMKPRSPYNEMRMQQKRKHTLDRPGYGRTAYFG